MNKETPTIYELLEEELQRRFFASGKKLTPDELFDKDKVCDWMLSVNFLQRQWRRGVK